MKLAAAAVMFVAGITAGRWGVPTLQAQTAAKQTFVIAETHVTNPLGFTDYMRHEPATLAAFHGRVVARALPDMREGAPTDGTVTIYQFDSAQDANRWYNSPEYAKLLTLRQQSAESRVYFLTGIVRGP